MAIEKNIKINVDTKEAVKETQKLEKGFDKAGTEAKQTQAEISTLTGGVGARFSGLLKSIKSVALGFKSIGFAIAASGIGLLILTIAAVSAAFKGSEEGQNKFAKLMGVIGAVTGNIIDVLADLGDFIIDLFSGSGTAMTSLKSFGKSIFNVIGLPIKNTIDTVKALGKAIMALASGDITGAMAAVAKGAADVKENFNEAKDSINGATDALKDFVAQNLDEADAAAKVADQRAKADKIERDLIVQRAKAEGRIADLRLKARDLNNVSARERQDALKEVLRIQTDLTDKETELLILRRDAIIAENTFARSNKENLTAEQEAIAAVIAIETRRTDQKRAIQRELTQTENELSKGGDKEAKREKEKGLFDELVESKKKELEFINENELRSKESLNNALLAEEQRLANSEVELTQLTADQKLAIEEGLKNAKIAQATQLLGNLGKLATEGSALSKGIAASQASINTFQGVTAALSATSVIPDPFGSILKFVNAAAIGVSGAINVKKILDTKPVSTTAPSGGAGGRAPAPPSFNLVQGTASNQISNSLQTQEPVRAIVVSRDVTSAQEANRNSENNSTL